MQTNRQEDMLMIEFWTVSERTGLKQTEDNQGGNWLTKVQPENVHENGVYVFDRFSSALASYFQRTSGKGESGIIPMPNQQC